MMDLYFLIKKEQSLDMIITKSFWKKNHYSKSEKKLKPKLFLH
jgi:hypothetical protein